MGRTRKANLQPPSSFPLKVFFCPRPQLLNHREFLPCLHWRRPPPALGSSEKRTTEQKASAEEAAAMQTEFIFEELTDQQKFDQMKMKFDGKGSHSQART